jgi:hypothetical protein
MRFLRKTGRVRWAGALCKPSLRLAPYACLGALCLAIACRSAKDAHQPSILFMRVPPAQAPGTDLVGRVSGRVTEAKPGARIVLYAHGKNVWWVQPFRRHPYTELASDGSWENVTHLGWEYAALLVAPGFQPPAKLPALPAVNGNILAAATVKGSPGQLPPPKILHFSGYDWKVRSSVENRAGELCEYESANAWVDDHGSLHLLRGQTAGEWRCAGITLTRSLGYGTYRFVVPDSAHLPPSAAFTMYTRAESQDPEDRTDLDIEMSRWGKATNHNAHYVVQPYYIPGNSEHFEVPAGPMTYVLRWEPGRAAFRAIAGTSPASRSSVMEHIFTAGIPVPATETIHLDLYDFHHQQSGLQHPVEIVVQKFEYLP